MAAKFKPVALTRDGSTQTAQTAEQEAKMRWNGWRTAPKVEAEPEKPAEGDSTSKPKPSAPKS